MTNAPFRINPQISENAPAGLKEVIAKWADAVNATIEFTSDPSTDESAAYAAFDMALFAVTSLAAPMIEDRDDVAELVKKFTDSLAEQSAAFQSAVKTAQGKAN